MRFVRLFLLVVLVSLGGFSEVAAQRFVPPIRPPAVPRITPGPFVHPVVPHTHQPGNGADAGEIIVWVVVGIVGLVVFFFVFRLMAWGMKKTVRIRIIGIPPGEAPDTIRSAWVGLELPLAPGETGLRTHQQLEVISLQVTDATEGYIVDGKQALDLLAAHNPDAAAWWRTNCAAPLDSGGRFAFPPDVCEVVS